MAGLTFDALNLDGGIVSFPRPKTAIPRKAFLWPETIEAIRAWLAVRQPPTDHALANTVFITEMGTRYSSRLVSNCAISREFRMLLIDLQLHRPRLGFYSLRHQFQTIGDEAGDHVATSTLMGHSDSSMASLYRESISDDRLRKVTDHIRAWLFPVEEKPVKKAPRKGTRKIKPR